MGDYFVTILALLNVIHWENKIIVSCLLEKDKADSACNSMDKALNELIKEFNNKNHSDYAE